MTLLSPLGPLHSDARAILALLMHVHMRSLSLAILCHIPCVTLAI